MAEPMLLKETGILCGPELRKDGDDMPPLFLSPATNAHGDGRFNPTVLTDDNPDFPLPDPVTGALGLIGLELDPNINDGDVDGSDLAAYIIDSKGLLLETFAADFGKTNCSQD